jgi:hypothetical protein
MDKLFIYGGITLGSIFGAYIPVLLLNADPLGLLSIICGIIGSFLGLWAGWFALQNIGE